MTRWMFLAILPALRDKSSGYSLARFIPNGQYRLDSSRMPFTMPVKAPGDSMEPPALPALILLPFCLR
jgi:hypothetical protein